MIRLAVENSPVEAAWAAFDAAAIAFHAQYRAVACRRDDTPDMRAARMKVAQDVARLWDQWRALFLADDHPGDAA